MTLCTPALHRKRGFAATLAERREAIALLLRADQAGDAALGGEAMHAAAGQLEPGHRGGRPFRHPDLRRRGIDAARHLDNVALMKCMGAPQRLVLRPLRLDACYNWSGCSPACRSSSNR